MLQQKQVDPEYLKKMSDIYKQVFETENGKKILDDLKSKFSFLNSTLALDIYKRVDPNATMYNEGQRSVVVIIENMINLDIEEIKKLQRKGSDTGGAK